MAKQNMDPATPLRAIGGQPTAPRCVETVETGRNRLDATKPLDYHARHCLRWKREGRGKSGGVRVIYYYHSDVMPLYLLAAFAKNEQANLSKAERNELGKLVAILNATARRHS